LQPNLVIYSDDVMRRLMATNRRTDKQKDLSSRKAPFTLCETGP